MARILIVWEFGGGLGHLLRLRSIAQALVSRGHQVTGAFGNLSQVPEIFSGSGISFIQAPAIEIQSGGQHIRLSGFAEILSTVGFGNEKILAPMFAAWTEIIDKYKPDLLIADYAPFALLASHGLGFRRVNIGLPFYCPPDVFPLPRWGNPEQMKDATHLLETERQITDQVNRLLAQHNRPQLKQMASLFNQVDGIFLATYPELDPYGARSGIRYWGHWNVSTGLDVKWPEGRGAKIFAYLKPFPGLEELLRQFKESDCPTIAVSHQISPELQERYKAPTMLFENRPLNMSAIAAGCDLAIFHAGHGTIASMLLAGKPCLLFPKYIEQSLNAQAVLKLGAGRMLAASMILQIGPALLDMQITDRYKNGARRFAARYKGSVPGEQVPQIADALEALAAHAPR